MLFGKNKLELDELNIYLLVIKFSNEGTFCIILLITGYVYYSDKVGTLKIRLSESFTEIHKAYMVNRYSESVY